MADEMQSIHRGGITCIKHEYGHITMGRSGVGLVDIQLIPMLCTEGALDLYADWT